MKKRLFTSESVTEGHPDKICDQISDAILDEILKKDTKARVACETAVTTGLVLVMGEISTECYVDIPKLVRKTIKDIGYDRAKYGFDGDTCAVLTAIDEQSPDIALGVNKALEAKEGEIEDNHLGAGDQGMVFGYACNETEELMPLAIMLAHKLTKRLSYVRKNNILNYLLPDGKSQVTVEYDGRTPVRIDTIIVSSQHLPSIAIEELRAGIIKEVINEVMPKEFMDDKTKILVNPTGRFVVGGPNGDSGLTGRKIIADTYGGYGRHGGGAFSGKDPSKVDRSAAYMARYAAKNIVAAELADVCEIEIAYAIGVAKPVSITVETFGTGIIPDEEINEIVMECFDFRPSSIIEKLELLNPIYKKIAAYGHFGRSELGLSWERTDMVDSIKKYMEK